MDELNEKDNSLVPSKYIEFVNRDEGIDFDTKIKDIQTELSSILAEEEKGREELKELFKNLGLEL